jgi:hypothetical protein
VHYTVSLVCKCLRTAIRVTQNTRLRYDTLLSITYIQRLLHCFQVTMATSPAAVHDENASTSGGMSTLHRLLTDILHSLQLPSSTGSRRSFRGYRKDTAAMFSPLPFGSECLRREPPSDRFTEPSSAIELYMKLVLYRTKNMYWRFSGKSIYSVPLPNESLRKKKFNYTVIEMFEMPSIYIRSCKGIA